MVEAFAGDALADSDCGREAAPASLRTVKDAGELALMKKAAEASMASHRAAMRAMKPGMNEREIAALPEL